MHYLIAAVSSGSKESVLHLIKEGKRSLLETGYVCTSPQRKNLVISNVLGCAAYNGHNDLLV
jgi:hypothetical protein